jgi:type I restriction enzyme, S subunit
LVARIDALAAKIDEAKRLRSEADEGIENLCRSFFHQGDDSQLTPTPMSELVRLREPDVTVDTNQQYHFAGVYCFGRGVFVGQRKTGMEFKYPRLTALRTGNFVYPKLMAWEGALAVVPPECNGLVVSTEFPVFEIDTTKVLPEVLDTYFRTPTVWPELSGTSTGTNMRRQRLNPADFLKYKFPLPAMPAQEKLSAIKKRRAEVAKHRNATIPALDAMLPAILDRAFRGEL